MKTTTFKSLLVKLSLLIFVSQVSANDLIYTQIDLNSVNYQDKMWVYSVLTCTKNYDDGWDGYKMFGGEFAPQFFAWEADGKYQIDVIPDLNNTYIGFKAGRDSDYTLTFTNQNLALSYQHLYLIDSIADKTVEIYLTGTTYSFTAHSTPEPVKRFKIVTRLPLIVQSTATLTAISKVSKETKESKIKLYSSHKTIYIDNEGDQTGKLKIYNAISGSLVKNAEFHASGKTIIETDLPEGTYILNGETKTEEKSIKVVVI